MADVTPPISSNLTLPVWVQSGTGSALVKSVYPRAGASLLAVLGTNFYSILGSVAFARLSILQNQVNSYLASALITQNNITNLTQALTDVAGGDAAGTNTAVFTSITVTFGSTGPVITPTYTTMTVRDFVNQPPFNLTLLTGTGSAVQQNNVTQITQAISNQQNILANEQTFLNSAVTSIQSNVALIGQIVQALNAVIQTIESLTR